MIDEKIMKHKKIIEPSHDIAAERLQSIPLVHRNTTWRYKQYLKKKYNKISPAILRSTSLVKTYSGFACCTNLTEKLVEFPLQYKTSCSLQTTCMCASD